MAVPFIFPLAAVIVVLPSASAVNTPAEFIVPTIILLFDQLIAEVKGLPNWSSGEAVKVSVEPLATVAEEGDIIIEVKVGCADVVKEKL